MRKTTSIIMVTFVISLILAGAVPRPSSAEPALPKAVALGTSSIGSAFYVIAVGMADIISKHTAMSATAEAVGGSDANMRAIRMGKVHLAMTNTFSSDNAFRGVKQFAAEGKIPIRLLALGQPSLRQTVARVASGIEVVPDLRGKKLVAKRRALAEIELVADAMLKVYGISKKDVTYIATAKTGEAIDGLITGTIDAAVIPGGVPSATLMKLFERIDARFIDIPADKLKEILDELGPAFHSEVIPAGTYRGQDKGFLAPSLSASLVVAEDFPEEGVYQIVKALFEHYDDFKLVHKAARHWTVKNSLTKFHIPLHPGAIKYFRQIGAWTSEYEKRQRDLLEKK
jgi:TRAP transporter TAXI family solute receptor